jgi:hypothetical protein
MQQTPSTARRAWLGIAAAATLAAITVQLLGSSGTVQAQPNPNLLAQQAPAACVCAQPAPVFSTSGPVIAHCQCGALSCAAITGSGGAVVLQCAR